MGVRCKPTPGRGGVTASHCLRTLALDRDHFGGWPLLAARKTGYLTQARAEKRLRSLRHARFRCLGCRTQTRVFEILFVRFVRLHTMHPSVWGRNRDAAFGDADGRPTTSVHEGGMYDPSRESISADGVRDAR
jgi:hypothetical protein